MSEIKRRDVEALSAKLETFAKGLPEQEQEVLNWLVARAKSSDTEISDADLNDVSGGLAQSLGFGDDDQSITVSWSRSFAN